MYEQVEKPKENRSRAVANSLTHKQDARNQGIVFVDNRNKVVQLGGGDEKVTPGYKRETDFDVSQANEASTSDVRAAFGGGKSTGSDGNMYAHAVSGTGDPRLCTEGSRATSMTNQPGSIPSRRGQVNLPFAPEHTRWTQCVEPPNAASASQITKGDQQGRAEAEKERASLTRTRDREINKPTQTKAGKKQVEKSFSYLLKLW